ncbi:unnamed protein product [Strongylus vulgaris]|uniref:Uncharacterized protein n=1 Tax=Strongylus vulgaris TaxID=40348 RepID=A0A3P7IVG9_STRVU|nr:unnamed protein product [Strongylus vulgaris]
MFSILIAKCIILLCFVIGIQGVQSPTCRNYHCNEGFKCVMVEPPDDCRNCPMRPYCVLRECCTRCDLNCARGYKCMLTATDWCPYATCGPPVEDPPPEE